MAAEPAPRTWTVTVHGRLPTGNELLRGNRWQRFRVLDTWRDWIVLACRAEQVPVLGRARVTLTRYAPGSRPIDYDGLVAAGKGCIDGLVAAGVVEDDGPAYLEVTYRSARCPVGQARVELVIEERS